MKISDIPNKFILEILKSDRVQSCFYKKVIEEITSFYDPIYVIFDEKIQMYVW